MKAINETPVDRNYQPSVLIVEQNLQHALKTKVALENAGCRVNWADKGLLGLDWVQRKAFDLIVLDGKLPDISGFQLCRRLKADPKLAAIPVVILTPSDQSAETLPPVEAEAIEYIPKDAFADNILADTISQLLGVLPTYLGVPQLEV